MVKFGISIYGISRKIRSGELTPARAFEKLAEMGAEVAELVPFGFDISSDPAVLESLAEASEKTGLPIGNYSLNANFLMLDDAQYEAELERVKKHIDAAARLGIPTFRMDSCAYSRPISENTIERFESELPLIIKTYENVCDHAAKYGMTLLLENHGFHANGSDRVRRILTGVKRDNFAHQLDVGNYVCVDEKPEIAVKKMIGFAKTIHMKDFYIRPENRNPGDASTFNCENSWFRSVGGSFLRGSILAQGDLDIWSIMKTVKDSSFDGNIYLEYEGMEECEYGTRLSFENMKRIWNEV